MEYTISQDLTEAEAHGIGEKLDAYNARKTGFDDERPLRLAVRTPSGELLGGLNGVTGAQWMYIHILWIEAPHRLNGIGAEVLSLAEAIAIDRGCSSACLMTFSYQAREFYGKCGYTVFGQLDDYPEGHTLYFMRKRLA